jgi:hypothetical protein
LNQALRPLIFALVFMAATASACAPHAPDAHRVAVIGDSEGELQHGIQTAIAAGKTPLYATVAFGKRTFIFSPYAQIARTPSMIVVRAFATIWRFPIERARVQFAGSAVAPDALPEVKVPDSWQLPVHSSAMQVPATDAGAVTDTWNGAKDPWQQGPPLTPWTKGAALDAQNAAELTP